MAITHVMGVVKLKRTVVKVKHCLYCIERLILEHVEDIAPKKSIENKILIFNYWLCVYSYQSKVSLYFNHNHIIVYYSQSNKFNLKNYDE